MDLRRDRFPGHLQLAMKHVNVRYRQASDRRRGQLAYLLQHIIRVGRQCQDTWPGFHQSSFAIEQSLELDILSPAIDQRREHPDIPKVP